MQPTTNYYTDSDKTAKELNNRHLAQLVVKVKVSIKNKLLFDRVEFVLQVHLFAV